MAAWPKWRALITQKSTYDVILGRCGSSQLAPELWVADPSRPSPADPCKPNPADPARQIPADPAWQIHRGRKNSQLWGLAEGEMVLIVIKFKHLIGWRVYFFG